MSNPTKDPAGPPPVTTDEFAAAFEQAPVGMAITGENASILHANAALANMLGYKTNELVGKSVVDLTYPEDLAESRASNMRLGRGEVTQFSLEKRYLHKSGRIVWARVYVSRLDRPAERHYLLHVADITHEKSAKEALRETEERFHEMAESIDQDFWIMSLNPPRLLYTSPAAMRIWGFDTMVNQGRPGRILKHVHPDDAVAFVGLFDPARPDARELEYRVVRPDGAARWFRTRVFPMINSDGVIVRLTGVTEDITPRKEAEQEVERHAAFERFVMKLSAEFANRTAERMQEGFEMALAELGTLIGADRGSVFVIDEATDVLAIKYFWSAEGIVDAPFAFTEFSFGPKNPFRTRILGEGMVCVDDVTSMPDNIAASRDRILATGIRAFINVPLVRRGELIGLCGFGVLGRTTVWSADAKAYLTIAAEVLADAIERTRMEAEIRTHRDALAHTLRVGTMGQLASGIAHELNQPLAAILNYASACERRIASGDVGIVDIHDTVRKIAEQAIRAGDVIKTLRALVRKGESTRTWHDINDLVRTALSFIEPETTDAGIDVVIDCTSELPRVQVDPIQIEQVILNLVRNAVDAVRAADDDGRRRIRVATRLRKPSTIEVTVTDTGPGISKHLASHVFDEFYTTKSHGLGLGLSISRSIVEAHGGELSMDETSPSGTTFRFTLPSSS